MWLTVLLNEDVSVDIFWHLVTVDGTKDRLSSDYFKTTSYKKHAGNIKAWTKLVFLETITGRFDGR